jgi:hypothetical protein
MLRKMTFALIGLTLLGVAAAQIVISPTVTTDPDVIAKGAQSASVQQVVELELPQATALHLATGTIEFDLTALDGDDWAARAASGAQPTDFGYACVYVSGADVVNGLGSAFWGQTQVIPGGIAYAADTWDQIHLVYFGNGLSGNVPDGERVVTYPPIRIGADGKLVEGSKEYFVCYQTFVIQLFSNWDYFRLQVSRTDTTDQGIEHLYVQGNTCNEFGSGTGLYDLPNGQTRDLLPRALTAGPTGSRNAAGCNPNSSWMDLLGVLAVKVNADHFGTSTANLTYTLLSSDTTF